MGLQFKPELAQKIMAGAKTQTRRPFKNGDVLVNGRLTRLTKTGKARTQWQVGQTYAVQPGRSKKGIGTLEALEGGRWHLTITTREIVRKIRGGRVRIAGIHFDVVDYPVVIINLLKEHRPYELYTGWALTFHVVEEVQS